jgi:hypothetical protein
MSTRRDCQGLWLPGYLLAIRRPGQKKDEHPPQLRPDMLVRAAGPITSRPLSRMCVPGDRGRTMTRRWTSVMSPPPPPLLLPTPPPPTAGLPPPTLSPLPPAIRLTIMHITKPPSIRRTTPEAKVASTNTSPISAAGNSPSHLPHSVPNTHTHAHYQNTYTPFVAYYLSPPFYFFSTDFFYPSIYMCSVVLVYIFLFLLACHHHPPPSPLPTIIIIISAWLGLIVN